MIRTTTVTVTTNDGGAGTSSGNADTESIVNGNLLAVQIDYTDQAATTDVTITSVVPAYTILTVTDSNTDALIAPRLPCVNTANAAITNSHGLIPLVGKLNVAVAQASPLKTVAVTFFYQTDWRG